MGFFVKNSTRLIKPPRIEYKGFKFKIFRRGEIIRTLITHQRYRIPRLDGAVLTTRANMAIILKRRHDVQSRYLRGPALRYLNRKRFIILFKKCI